MLSPATRNRQVITPVQAVINHCYDLGLCDPIKIKRFPNLSKPKRVAVNDDWIYPFMEAAKEPFPHLPALALFMYQSATRIGNALDVLWGDVNLYEKTVLLRKTKTGGEHEVHLTDECMILIANLPRSPDTKRVFYYKSRSSIYTPWHETCDLAGIPYVPPHQSGRHSFATKMIVEHGIDVATVAKIGGWSNPTILLNTYSHGADARDTLEKVFGGNHNTVNIKRTK